MSAFGELVFPAIGLLFASLVLTAVSLWVGGRLAPWFLKEAVEPPSVRSYFLEPMADVDLDKARMVTLLIATAIMLFALLVIAVAVRFTSVPLV